MTASDILAPQSKVHVSLGDRSYDIAIGHGLLPGIGARIAPLLPRPLTAIVTDENVASRHLQMLEWTPARGRNPEHRHHPSARRGDQELR